MDNDVNAVLGVELVKRRKHDSAVAVITPARYQHPQNGALKSATCLRRLSPNS